MVEPLNFKFPEIFPESPVGIVPFHVLIQHPVCTMHVILHQYSKPMKNV